MADPTMFLVNGKFVQPLAAGGSSGDMVATTPSGGTEHRLALPAGEWDARWMELTHDVVTVTLVAAQELTCTRFVPLDSGVSGEEVVVAVDGGTLVITIPPAANVPVDDSAAPVQEEEELADLDASDKEEDKEEDKEDEPTDAEPSDEENDEINLRWGDDDDDMLVFKKQMPRKSSAAACKQGLVQRRSRRSAQARRRAAEACATRRQATAAKQRASPAWKAAQRHAASVAGLDEKDGVVGDAARSSAVELKHARVNKVHDPDRMQRWSDEDLANVAMPPVCVLAI